MKVKLLTIMAGPQGCVDAGRVIEVDDETAEALIEGFHAIPYVEPSTPSTAADPAPGAQVNTLKPAAKPVATATPTAPKGK